MKQKNVGEYLQQFSVVSEKYVVTSCIGVEQSVGKTSNSHLMTLILVY